MNDLDVMADSLFLPLSLYASLSDIKSRAISTSTEIMLLMFGILMILIRITISGFLNPLQTIINNAPPILFLLLLCILGKSGFGDLEYAISMVLFYPNLMEASTFSILSIFEKNTIFASVISIALINAILFAWFITFFGNVANWLKERNFPIIGKYIAIIAIPIFTVRAQILTLFLSFLLNKHAQSIIDVPFIPFMFVGFMIARYANIILL